MVRMNLFDLSKLPKDQIRVIDKTKADGYPARWYNAITIIHGNKSHSLRRYTAFNHGLCEGVQGEMPPTYQRGGIKEGRGRKPLKPHEKKIQCSIWLQTVTVEFLGGKKQIEKEFENFIKSKL